MTTIAEYNQYGEDLERILILRTSPMAVKMLATEADIPEGAVRPKRDLGEHLAQCQAFALSRRQKKTIAMLNEDSWCFAPLIAYGMVDKPDDPRLEQFTTFPRFETGRYIGIVSAPLKTANFAPDVVVIYSNTAQLRSLLLPVAYEERDEVAYRFFPPACSYQVVPPMTDGHLMVTLPDPGDYQRALAGEDEVILSVPPEKLGTLIEGVKRIGEWDFGYANAAMYMKGDFPRPEFYRRLFESWGLETGE